MGILQNRQFERMKPFIAVVFLQFGYAGMDVLSKAALNKGMSNYVFVVYRHAVAFVVITPFAVILDKYVFCVCVCVFILKKNIVMISFIILTGNKGPG